MADRYISEKALIENIAKIEDLRTLSTKTVGEAISMTPTADVVEVKHGEWIEIKGEKEVRGTLTCSCCNYIFARIYPRNYCPHCGAKMDGGKAE